MSVEPKVNTPTCYLNEDQLRINSNEFRIYGSTGVAFACCLSELLLNIQNSLINMFASMKDISTILKVHQYGNSMMMVCERLCNLCSIQVNGEEVKTIEFIKKKKAYQSRCQEKTPNLSNSIYPLGLNY